MFGLLFEKTFEFFDFGLILGKIPIIGSKFKILTDAWWDLSKLVREVYGGKTIYAWYACL